MDHPISLEVVDELRRSRLTVLLRLVLAIPHYLWWTGWGLVVVAAVAVQWLFLLVAGRPARRLHRFVAAYLRYSTHLSAYLMLVANPYPRFRGRRGYAVELFHPLAEPQRRWKTLLRLPLVVPAWVFSQVLDRVADVVAFLAWFACVLLGRIPKGMRDLNVYILRYRQQTLAYLLLLTDRYPQLASAERYLPKQD
jgi:hypothetical protein